jgi:hypothetical protein
MAEPTLQQVFGAGAAQTATTLTITKADFSAVGLTASANNTAESLFVAILLLARQQLTDANQVNNPEQSITITDGFPAQSLVTRNNQQFRQNTFAVNLQKPDSGSILDPDDY